MSNSKQWQQIDQSCQVEHIDDADRCWFFRRYVGAQQNAGFTHDDTNKVLNFKYNKKDPKYAQSIQHIDDSRRQFACDLSLMIRQLISRNHQCLVVISFIPTSTAKTDENYNNCFEELESHLKLILSDSVDKVRFESLITQQSTRGKWQGSRGDSYIQSIKSGWCWSGFRKPITTPTILVIVDDVITSGGQYKAFKQMVQANIRQPLTMMGLFWSIKSANV